MDNPDKKFGRFPFFKSKEARLTEKLERSFNRINLQYQRVKAHHANFLVNTDYDGVREELLNRAGTFTSESDELLNREGKEFIADIHQRVHEVDTYQGDIERHMVSVLLLLRIPPEYMQNPDALMQEYPLLGHYYRAMQSLVTACEAFIAEYDQVFPGRTERPTEP